MQAEVKTTISAHQEPMQQYAALYGPYVAGPYAIGDEIKYEAFSTGTVIWSYRDAERGLTYVLDNDTGFSVEALASELPQPR
jgi:hypothetical protein